MNDSIADDLLRSGYNRWLRLEEEKQAISQDLKELFIELKGNGFTPKALRESFRRVRNINEADQQEHDALVDLYVASLTCARPAHTREASTTPAEQIMAGLHEALAIAKGEAEPHAVHHGLAGPACAGDDQPANTKPAPITDAQDEPAVADAAAPQASASHSSHAA